MPRPKKIIAKKEEEIKEIEIPVIEVAPVMLPARNAYGIAVAGGDDIADDDISEEIAKTIKETSGKSDRYIEAIGRRKTAVARVRLFTKGDKEFLVNN